MIVLVGILLLHRESVREGPTRDVVGPIWLCVRRLNLWVCIWCCHPFSPRFCVIGSPSSYLLTCLFYTMYACTLYSLGIFLSFRTVYKMTPIIRVTFCGQCFPVCNNKVNILYRSCPFRYLCLSQRYCHQRSSTPIPPYPLPTISIPQRRPPLFLQDLSLSLFSYQCVETLIGFLVL